MASHGGVLTSGPGARSAKTGAPSLGATAAVLPDMAIVGMMCFRIMTYV